MEKVQGVKIRRAWLFPRGRGGGGRLALNYFSWAFFASFYAFFLSLFHKYDVVLVHEPSPITQGIPAIIIKKMQRIPVYFWVLDLWPESLISAGGVTNKYVISFFTKIVKWIYNSSDKILISSKGFRQSILEKEILRVSWFTFLIGQKISFLLFANIHYLNYPMASLLCLLVTWEKHKIWKM